MKRWTGIELEALRGDYIDLGLKLSVLEIKYRTSSGNIMRLARLHGWPRRRPAPNTSDLARMLNIRQALRWRIRQMEDRLKRMDSRISEMKV